VREVWKNFIEITKLSVSCNLDRNLPYYLLYQGKIIIEKKEKANIDYLLPDLFVFLFAPDYFFNDLNQLFNRFKIRRYFGFIILS